ncbi:MAG: tetratricopeptide repeat protein [Acidobacteriia bacterium]|nr:tetratricopeptide repeat protein [Terriglobia bacterium]
MKFRNVAVGCAGSLLLAFTALAQTTARIEGTVLGIDGKPLQNAQILFHRTDMKGDLKTKTDKKGHYIYMGLPVGAMYDISCEVDGKKADERQHVRASLSDPNNPNSNAVLVDFDMRKSAAAQAEQTRAVNEAATTGKISDELARKLSPEQKAAIEKAAKEREGALKKNAELNNAFNAGVTALEAKQFDQAIASFQKASELDPKQIAVWNGLADAYIQNAKGKTGADFDANVQKSIEAYNKALELKPDDAGIHNNYGRALAEAKKFNEATAEMAKAAQLDPPGAGKYYYNLGAILVNTNQSDQAAEAFKKAIEADPKYAEAYYQLGVYYVGKAQVDTATGKVTPAPGTVEYLQKYLELAPTGQFADSAKGLLAGLGGTVDTRYSNPNAPAKKTTTKKK